jgi:UDP-N-acetylmuramate: L-alanyl-gamma-D-glutamyl-meso-diaminopimelate ligase
MLDLATLPDAHLRIFDRPEVPPPGEIRDIYLIGICGTGMGSLAGLFQQAGYNVSGSDDAVYPPMSTRLAEMDIPVFEGFDAAHLEPAPDLVVIGNACTPTHDEAARAREQGMVQLSLPEALAHFFIAGRRSLVVAGTHGKTTTTGMLVHLLREAGLDPGFLVGGVMANTGASYAVGAGSHFVVEGDEYDSAYFDKQPKFMHYRPSTAIITSMEFDHADIYDDWDDYRSAFEAFARTLPSDGLLILNSDDPHVASLSAQTQARVRYYGLASKADVSAVDVIRGEGGQRFTLTVAGNAVVEIYLPMSGRHNLANALAAATAALEEGVEPAMLAHAFGMFRGMKRRQEVLGAAAGVLVMDDFAHHPTAVRETIVAVRERWPERRLVAVFEPRSNSSRRKVFEEAYADAFEAADHTFISSPPIRHNDSSEDLMDVDVVIDSLVGRGLHAETHPNAEALLPSLLEALRPGDTALIMSNGAFGGIHRKLLRELEERE